MPSLTLQDLNSIKALSSHHKDRDYPVFIETGTHLAETVTNLASEFERIETIEIKEDLYQISKTHTEGLSNVFCTLGDSSKLLKEIVQRHSSENIVFFLDGHYSSGITGKGDKDCPLLEELQHIDEFYRGEAAIIIVDDLRLFGTHLDEDWTDITLENISKAISQEKIGSVDTLNDRLILFYQEAPLGSSEGS